jgi:hypothetical protein
MTPDVVVAGHGSLNSYQPLFLLARSDIAKPSAATE